MSRSLLAASRLAVTAALGLSALLASGTISSGYARDLVLPRTGEAALGQPMVVIAIGDKPKAATTKSRNNPLEDLGDDLPAVAILDTGASGHVLSAATAERFAVEAESGSRYVETGMSGDHAMMVSRAAALAVSDFEPEDEDAESRRGARRAPSTVRLPGQRFLLNEGPRDLAAALVSPGSMVDVVGMPLLRDRVVEIAPHDGDVPSLAVRLHASTAGLRVDAWVPLTLVDFNGRDPRNRGPRPALAENPVVPGVRTVLGAAHAEGDWLLDTGAVCTMISTAAARRLGLVDADGDPNRRPEFSLPVGGIGGGSKSLPGFRLDRLELAADGGPTLVFPDAAVVVHDVTTTRADGTAVTLDGILGMNLLLPSGSGMTMLGTGNARPSPFARVVIDVPGERLGFALAD